MMSVDRDALRRELGVVIVAPSQDLDVGSFGDTIMVEAGGDYRAEMVWSDVVMSLFRSCFEPRVLSPPALTCFVSSLSWASYPDGRAVWECYLAAVGKIVECIDCDDDSGFEDDNDEYSD